MLDVITALRAARSVQQFVEAGGLEDAVASIDVKAAQEALRKVNMARDPRAQVWSAVNHLEGAEEAARRAAMNWRLHYFNELSGEVADERHVYVLALLAICYKYLGEFQLCDDALDKARKAHYDAPWDHRRPLRSRVRAITVQPSLWTKAAKALVTPGGYVGDEVDRVRVDVTALQRVLQQS
jgi:tetratricopeptide (TPR) repeat protein